MDKYLFFLGAFIVACVTAYELYTGETIPPRRRQSLKYSRAQEPVKFWLTILFQAALAIGFLLIGLFAVE